MSVHGQVVPGEVIDYSRPPLSAEHEAALRAERAMAAELVKAGGLRGVFNDGEFIGVAGREYGNGHGYGVVRLFPTGAEERTVVATRARAEQTQYDGEAFDADYDPASGPLNVTKADATTLGDAIEFVLDDLLSDDDDAPVDSDDHGVDADPGEVRALDMALLNMYRYAGARVRRMRSEAAEAQASRELNKQRATSIANLAGMVLATTFPDAHAALYPAPEAATAANQYPQDNTGESSTRMPTYTAAAAESGAPVGTGREIVLVRVAETGDTPTE